GRFELARVGVCLPLDHGWQVFQGGEEPVIVDEAVLEQTLASTRGALEFDARQRAYGGHTTGRDSAGQPVSLVPLRHGIKTIGVPVGRGPPPEGGTPDAVPGGAA